MILLRNIFLLIFIVLRRHFRFVLFLFFLDRLLYHLFLVYFRLRFDNLGFLDHVLWRLCLLLLLMLFLGRLFWLLLDHNLRNGRGWWFLVSLHVRRLFIHLNGLFSLIWFSRWNLLLLVLWWLWYFVMILLGRNLLTPLMLLLLLWSIILQMLISLPEKSCISLSSCLGVSQGNQKTKCQGDRDDSFFHFYSIINSTSYKL